jgi:truncated hemoglobin YjbI
MHFYAGFTDPARDGRPPSLFEWAGGLPALTRMTRLLYEKHVPADPLLAELFAGMPPGYARHEASRMGEAFGGPASRDGEVFEREKFSEEQRGRWVALAGRAAGEAGLPDDAGFRAALAAFVEWDSRGGTAPPGWDWTAAGPPEAPRDAAAAQDAASDEQPPALPGPDEPVSFAAHIKPMFREHDRDSMRFTFDLWSYDDVRAHAAGILDRLAKGSMPCDGAWPAPQIDVFRHWTESGTPA